MEGHRCVDGAVASVGRGVAVGARVPGSGSVRHLAGFLIGSELKSKLSRDLSTTGGRTYKVITFIGRVWGVAVC